MHCTPGLGLSSNLAPCRQAFSSGHSTGSSSQRRPRCCRVLAASGGGGGGGGSWGSGSSNSSSGGRRSGKAERKARQPGLYEVKVVTPPPRSLGVHALPPNTHNGDLIELEEGTFVVTCLVLQFKVRAVVTFRYGL